MMELRQSTTVPKMSKTNAFGAAWTAVMVWERVEAVS